MVFDSYYEIYATIETNYSRLAIIWPKDRVVPAEYRNYYGNDNMYPVEIEYVEEKDIVHLSEYFGNPYKTVQLPAKRSLY